MNANNCPILSQTVRWGEHYVSRALNMKTAGIIPAGIYHGFKVKPGGEMAVLVDHAPDYPRSVAVVERDGYSLTIIMDDAGMVNIPAPGKWYICIEAFYAPTKQGYQRIVAREDVEAHHVILATVDVGEDVAIITEAMIDYAPRMEYLPLPQLMEITNLRQIENSKAIIILSDWLMKEKLKRLSLEKSLRDQLTSPNITNITLSGQFSPAGYITQEGATIAPVTIVNDGGTPPVDAALTIIVANSSSEESEIETV